MEQLSSAEARRIALAAQGFGVQRSDKVTAAQWRTTIDRLSLHQIDSLGGTISAIAAATMARDKDERIVITD